MKKQITLFLAALLIPILFSAAQQVEIKITSDTSHYLIGDHVHISIDITTDTDARIEFPNFVADIFPPLGLDWIKSSSIDTMVDGNRKNYHQTITITSFDEGKYQFPPIEVMDFDSVVLAVSEPLFFEITTVAVDTTSQLRDIKQPVKVPLTFREILPYAIIALVALLSIGLVILLILKMKKKEGKTTVKVKVKPKIRPDIAALAALDKLWNKKLWQEGKIKAYYSELTEIVRTYIDDRFDIDAMEMVSNDILEEIQVKNIPPEAYKILHNLLITADLVKFAKWDPIPDDHSRCFTNAKQFVELTADKSNTNPEEPKK
ncbi:MAG: hypothetical protein LBV02_01470 [Bacteroidales bacterium]|jgi:hypothetical protein|nr:hypothetical protein [Bacteroidales bacterium]